MDQEIEGGESGTELRLTHSFVCCFGCHVLVSCRFAFDNLSVLSDLNRKVER